MSFYFVMRYMTLNKLIICARTYFDPVYSPKDGARCDFMIYANGKILDETGGPCDMVHATAHSSEGYCCLSTTEIRYHRTPDEDIQCYDLRDTKFVQAVCVNETGPIFVVDSADHLYYVVPVRDNDRHPVPVKHTGLMRQFGINNRSLVWRAADNQLYTLEDVETIQINPNIHEIGPNTIQIGPGKKFKSFPKANSFLQGNNGKCTFFSPYVMHLNPFCKNIPLIDVETGEILEIIQAEFSQYLCATLLITSAGELWVADAAEMPLRLKHIPFVGVALHVISIHHWFFVTFVGGQNGLLGHTRMASSTHANLGNPGHNGWYWYPINISPLSVW